VGWGFWGAAAARWAVSRKTPPRRSKSISPEAQLCRACFLRSRSSSSYSAELQK
jgi:hypothetical protein